MKPFPSQAYALPSCTLSRMKRAEAPDIAARLVTMDPWRTLEYQADAFAAYLSRPDATFLRFTVNSSGSRAGLLGLRYPWLKGVYLEILALFPPYQGLGLGREVMAFVEARARSHTKNFWLAVSSFNHKALRFYKDLGFCEVARLENLIKEGYDELLLRKIL